MREKSLTEKVREHNKEVIDGLKEKDTLRDALSYLVNRGSSDRGLVAKEIEFQNYLILEVKGDYSIVSLQRYADPVDISIHPHGASIVYHIEGAPVQRR